ncbi:MAG: hypothetical protein M3144_09170 [Actinomycetota bacterium]|nr:hypothetical protein [Actinomycetota bacterium]
MGNVCGRATAITVLTPIRPGLVGLSRLGFILPRKIPWMTEALRKLSFIHFARWSIIDRIPDNGPPQRPERPRYTYLFFESNFNGTWDDYIDSFSYVMPVRMRLTWGSSFGFPGAKPVGSFKRYITHNEFEADHFYSAYPEATTTMVQSALELSRMFDAFRSETAALAPEDFAAAWRRFLASAQNYL